MHTLSCGLNQKQIKVPDSVYTHIDFGIRNISAYIKSNNETLETRHIHVIDDEWYLELSITFIIYTVIDKAQCINR